MTGVELIAAERRRQVEEEGWTPEHDAEHTDQELPQAAVCYATPEKDRLVREHDNMPPLWPEGWHHSWWKPGGEIRDLVKAGALIAAEIDRLLVQEEADDATD